MTQLTSTQDAIKQAILEGHYGPSYWRTRFERDPQTQWKGDEYEEIFSFEAHNRILIDPLFWQALGKARGGWVDSCADCGGYLDGKNCVAGGVHSNPRWMDNALRFFETRLSNGDEKAFWQSLP